MPLEKKNKEKEKSKKKTVIPKYYAGTEVRKLPKAPKGMLKDLKDMETLIMSPEQRRAYLSAIALGLVPDKFGLEAGLDQKIKAISELNRMDSEGEFDDAPESVVIVDDVPNTDS